MLISVAEDAKPIFMALRDAVLRAGATYIADYTPTGAHAGARACLARPARDLPPGLLSRARRDDRPPRGDSLVERPRELDGVDPAKLMLERRTMQPYKRWLDQKEAEGRYSWTIASYGTAGDGEGGTAQPQRPTGSRSSRPASSTTPTRSSAGARPSGRSTGSSGGSTGSRSRGCTSRVRGSTFGSPPDGSGAGSGRAATTSRASRSSSHPTSAAPRARSSSTSRSTATAV